MPSNFRFEDGSIDPSQLIVQSREELRDYSTNLIGTFLPDDRNFLFTDQGKMKYLGDLWTPGELVEPPSDQDYLYSTESGQLFLLVGAILGHSISFMRGDETFTAVCQVLHTPVPGNFWHFSLRWITDEGDVIYQKGKWRKRLFSAARNMIVEKASLNIPNLTVIPEQFYKKS